MYCLAIVWRRMKNQVACWLISMTFTLSGALSVFPIFDELLNNMQLKIFQMVWEYLDIILQYLQDICPLEATISTIWWKRPLQVESTCRLYYAKLWNKYGCNIIFYIHKKNNIYSRETQIYEKANYLMLEGQTFQSDCLAYLDLSQHFLGHHETWDLWE